MKSRESSTNLQSLWTQKKSCQKPILLSAELAGVSSPTSSRLGGLRCSSRGRALPPTTNITTRCGSRRTASGSYQSRSAQRKRSLSSSTTSYTTRCKKTKGCDLSSGASFFRGRRTRGLGMTEEEQSRKD